MPSHSPQTRVSDLKGDPAWARRFCELSSVGLSGAISSSKIRNPPDGLATVSFTRGEITSADNGQVAIKEADNETQTFTLDSGTRVRVDGKQGSASDLKPGMQAVALTKQITGQSAELRGIGAKTSPSGG